MAVPLGPALFDKVIEKLQLMNGDILHASGVNERYSVFDYEASLRKIWIENKGMARPLYFESSSWGQVQCVTEILRNNDAASLVDFDGGIHNAIDNTIINGIFDPVTLDRRFAGVRWGLFSWMNYGEHI